MTIRVLIVDDSSFYRRQIEKLLSHDADLEVIATACNGQEAIEKTLELKPDVITMDIEMPLLDGISATKKIMRILPTPILMLSSLTTGDAKATLDALDAGALDFFPKNIEDYSRNYEKVKNILCKKIKAIVLSKRKPKPKPIHNPLQRPSNSNIDAIQPATALDRSKKINLVAIGSSTGGPVALQAVLTELPANFSSPIMLVQHMPATFTPAFAARLNQLCKITVKEAQDGDILQAATAYLAPGGKQMLVKKIGSIVRIMIKDDESELPYKPSVDVTFSSIAGAYSNNVLAIILTGMGADGREGAKRLKLKGSQVWSQDKDSCVVYGMPAAIATAGLADKVLSLSSMGSQLIQRV